MLWKVWVTVAAAVCGIGIATVLGGQLPAWAFVALLVLLLTAVVATLVNAKRYPHHANRSAQRRIDPKARNTPTPHDLHASVDSEIAQRLLGQVGSHEITWLREEEFVKPWVGRRALPIRELAMIEAGTSGVRDPALEATVDRLTGAARGFIEIYDSSTVIDPLTRDGEWRIIKNRDPTGQTLGPADPDSIVQSNLIAAAAKVCAGREALATMLMLRFPHRDTGPEPRPVR